MHTHEALDFGYPWWLTYGHVVVLVPALALLAAAWLRNWPKWLLFGAGALALWSAGAMFAVSEFNVNSPGSLPASNFFVAGKGNVLDLGAGTGRSAIMLLQARPEAKLVALDEFGRSFEEHFGPGKSPQERLLANLKIAGVDQRVKIETSDMRKLPFEAASFEAAISAYAVDHLPRDGAKQALAEAARVLKPGGEFLLILVNNDRYTKFAYGPLLTHGGTRGRNWWAERVSEAGFQIVEEGTSPATRFFHLKRP
jgi:SAM-dependent methyltransferase